jgi:oxygen-independent coproporphyrinogen-3 oxidase
MSVGLDHFVLPDDELAVALNTHQLHRNFQGYCTRRTTAQVYAFGVTGISQLDTAYAKTHQGIDEYVSAMAQGRLAVSKGYRLSAQERVAREVIEMLMCNYRVDWSALAAALGRSGDEVKHAVHYDEAQLAEMQADGVICYDADSLVMTGEGNPFVRNVAAALDPLMVNTTKKFSKPI